MKPNKAGPSIIQGACFRDERGRLNYYNAFDMAAVRRFYTITPANEKAIRAWQGHKVEQKWFCAIAGCFKIVLVAPDNWQHPSKDLIPEEFILKSENNEILHVPGGFANGFQSLEPGYMLIIFSDTPLSESGKDDFRFDKNLWYKWQ
jgi:dTDP-4-dehydrorhamnose 3,5-epimerase